MCLDGAIVSFWNFRLSFSNLICERLHSLIHIPAIADNIITIKHPFSGKESAVRELLFLFSFSTVSPFFTNHITM